jgi:hypothetical protein
MMNCAGGAMHRVYTSSEKRTLKYNYYYIIYVKVVLTYGTVGAIVRGGSLAIESVRVVEAWPE